MARSAKAIRVSGRRRKVASDRQKTRRHPRVNAKTPCMVAVAKAGPRHGTLVRSIRANLGLSRRAFCRLTGCSERAIANWESGRKPTGLSRQRMLEIQRLQEGLAQVMDSRFIAEWLETPNVAFDGLKPLEVVERGQIDRIWRMVFELESGVVS